MTTLYHLTAQEDKLRALGNEDTLDPRVLADTMESIQGEIEDKLISYVHVAEEENATVDAIDKKIKSLQARKKSHRNLAMRLMETAKATMEAHDWQKIETDETLVRVRKNPASVDIVDESKLPVDTLVEHTEYRPDKTLIKKRLQAGNEVNGAILKQTTRLEVK
jgi:hypothetical protein